MSSKQEDLKEQLDTLASRGSRNLRRWALKESIEASALKFFRFALVVPVLAIAGNLSGLFVGATLWPFSVVATLALALAGPIAMVAVYALFLYSRHKIDRRISLALYDRELGLNDRLQAADEFLNLERRNTFHHAAIDDARGIAQKALEEPLPATLIAGPVLRADEWRFGAAAVGLLVTALVISQFVLSPGVTVSDTRAERELADDAGASEESVDEEVLLPGDRREPLLAAQYNQQNAASRNIAGKSEENVFRPNARSQAAEGAGVQVGAKAGASKEDDRRADQENSRVYRKRRGSDAENDEDQKPSSGVASGKGGSFGSKTASSNHPGAENRAQRDEPEEDIGDEAEDEEDEEQQGASSSRPMLNQRKAASNRTLTPSTVAGEESSSSNGRGGPGGLKKTRGVAAMLLGVPLPDRVRGMANPGRVKVQREQSQPQEREVEIVAAADRGARDEAIGYVPHHDLSPRMRDLMRTYFLARREQSGGRGNAGEKEQ